MDKEILTYENIQNDLKKHYLTELRDLFIVFLFIPIANIFILNVILLFCNPNNNFKIIFSIIFSVICFLLVSYDLITILIGLLAIKREKIKISSDWIVDKKEKVYGSRISSPKPYRFIFAKNGIYKIPYGENYRWSNTFAISDKNLYEHTDINDEFYLVSVFGKNIIAYNKKFFELISR